MVGEGGEGRGGEGEGGRGKGEAGHLQNVTLFLTTVVVVVVVVRIRPRLTSSALPPFNDLASPFHTIRSIFPSTKRNKASCDKWSISSGLLSTR